VSGQRLTAEPIERKIERSSFGTPAARRCWRRTPGSVAQEILARVDDHDRSLEGATEDLVDQDRWEFIERLVTCDFMVFVESDTERLADLLDGAPQQIVSLSDRTKRFVSRSGDGRLPVVSPRFLLEQLAFRVFADDWDVALGRAGAARSVTVRLRSQVDVVPRLHAANQADPPSDRALDAAGDVEQAKLFDLAAFYTRHVQPVRSVCRALPLDPHLVDDVVQEVFLDALDRRPWERLDEDALGRWLLCDARQVAARRFREGHRRRAVPLDEADEAAVSIADPAADPEELAVRAERRALVAAALDGLGEQDRELLTLSMQGLDGQELAEALEVSPSGVYVRLHRARQRLLASVGALLLARRGADGCGALAAVLDGWDGQFRPVVRKRIVRHLEGCARCGELQRRIASPEQLL